MAAVTRTSIVPPPLASLEAERAQFERSSRSGAFVVDGGRLYRAWGPPERPWVLAVEARGARWTVDAWGADARAARTAARSLFSLDDPLEEFYALVRRDPALRGTERRFRGLRLPRDANLFEALVHAIVGQQLSVAAANAIHRRLVERTDSMLDVDGVEVPCVPAPAELLHLGEAGLRSLGLSGAKSRSLSTLAKGWPGLAVRTDRLAHAPLDDARAALTALRGVGPWTAENALLRGVGRRDVFVAGDLGIRVALDRFGVVPRAASEATARAWAERRYPGWGSYATLYLWRRLVAERSTASGG